MAITGITKPGVKSKPSKLAKFAQSVGIGADVVGSASKLGAFKAFNDQGATGPKKGGFF